MRFLDLFTTAKPIIGMIHLLPLPETPGYYGDLDAIYERALHDVGALTAAGIDGLLVENFGDTPYMVGEPTAAQLALMAAVTREVRHQVTVPVGVNVQFNAWQAEIAIAYATQAAFIRVEVFVDNVLTAQGIVSPCSAQIMRYRQSIGAANVMLLVDVQTKYTTSLIPQAITRSAKDAVAAGADALIVTGEATGSATPLDMIGEVKGVVDLPVLAGSGTTIDNVTSVLRLADGAIVGSSLKHDSDPGKPVSQERATTFMATARAMRDDSRDWTA